MKVLPIPRAILARARREGWAWFALEKGQLVAVAGRLSLFPEDVRKHCALVKVCPDSDVGYQRWECLPGGRA